MWTSINLGEKQTNTQLLGALVRVLVGKEYYIGTVFSMCEKAYLVEMVAKPGFTVRVTDNIYPIAVVERECQLPCWHNKVSGYDTLPYPGHWSGTTNNLHKDIRGTVNEHILVHDHPRSYVLQSLSLTTTGIRYEWEPADEKQSTTVD